MNPDIQRIAEKHFAFGSRDRCIEALTELSALRDTQEGELRELLSHYHFDTSDIQSVVKAIIEGNIKTTAELARRDEVEKELREELDEAHNVLIETRKCSTEAMGRIRAIVGATDNDPLPAEVYVEQLVASLRSRIGELEAENGALKMGFKPG